MIKGGGLCFGCDFKLYIWLLVLIMSYLYWFGIW
jgi:hypothetical protein